MKDRKVELPLSVLVEPDGFGERDFFAEEDAEYKDGQAQAEFHDYCMLRAGDPNF